MDHYVVRYAKIKNETNWSCVAKRKTLIVVDSGKLEEKETPEKLEHRRRNG